ncbi:MAG: hypothetical protein HRT36_09325 [Alphaproteobacteria bacterium]|nr:hypothetical protein [Alphaproteobacteria bacterium]
MPSISTIREAGKAFGALAVESMRMAKGYLHWASELITKFNPLESGIRRFVRFDQDFIGKTVWCAVQQAGSRRELLMFGIDC